MTLEVYTSTYTDVDANIFDSDDLVDEFNRIAQYLNAWAASIGNDDTTTTYEETHTIYESTIYDVSPSSGTLQKVIVDSGVEELAINFTEREDGDTYRIYLTIRSKDDLTFTVSGPSGETHVFSRNQSTFTTSQARVNNYKTAMVVATYGDANGLLVEVFSENTEATEVERNDALTVNEV